MFDEFDDLFSTGRETRKNPMLLLEAAEIEADKAILAYSTFQRMDDLRMRNLELRCMEESGNLDHLQDYYYEAKEETGEKEKNVLKRLWEKILQLWEKIKSIFTRRKKNPNLSPKTRVALPKPLAFIFRNVKKAWNAVKSVVLSGKKKLSENGNWKKLLAILGVAGLGVAVATFFRRRNRNGGNSNGPDLPSNAGMTRYAFLPETSERTQEAQEAYEKRHARRLDALRKRSRAAAGSRGEGVIYGTDSRTKGIPFKDEKTIIASKLGEDAKDGYEILTVAEVSEASETFGDMANTVASVSKKAVENPLGVDSSNAADFRVLSAAIKTPANTANNILASSGGTSIVPARSTGVSVRNRGKETQYANPSDLGKSGEIQNNLKERFKNMSNSELDFMYTNLLKKEHNGISQSEIQKALSKPRENKINNLMRYGMTKLTADNGLYRDSVYQGESADTEMISLWVESFFEQFLGYDPYMEYEDTSVDTYGEEEYFDEGANLLMHKEFKDLNREFREAYGNARSAFRKGQIQESQKYIKQCTSIISEHEQIIKRCESTVGSAIFGSMAQSVITTVNMVIAGLPTFGLGALVVYYADIVAQIKHIIDSFKQNGFSADMFNSYKANLLAAVGRLKNKVKQMEVQIVRAQRKAMQESADNYLEDFDDMNYDEDDEFGESAYDDYAYLL